VGAVDLCAGDGGCTMDSAGMLGYPQAWWTRTWAMQVAWPGAQKEVLTAQARELAQCGVAEREVVWWRALGCAAGRHPRQTMTGAGVASQSVKERRMGRWIRRTPHGVT
jgi:hypothetical protein